MATLPNRPKDNPWKLKTAPGTSEYTMHTDDKDGSKILVCTVGNTVLHYDARCCYVCLSQRAEVHAHPANGEGLRSSRF